MTDADLQGHPAEPVELRGVGVSPGVVVGPVARVVRPSAEPSSRPAPDVDAEVECLARALRTVAEDLTARSAAASGEIAEILSATAMMAEDPALASQARQFVRDHRVTAQRAVWVVADEYAVKLAGLGGYLAERASDVRDVRDRVVAELDGIPPPGLPEPGTRTFWLPLTWPLPTPPASTLRWSLPSSPSRVVRPGIPRSSPAASGWPAWSPARPRPLSSTATSCASTARQAP
jgi:hypothetical protein